MLIDFIGPPGSIARVSAADVLDGSRREISSPIVRGKLVLIGGVWGSARDTHFVPFANWSDNPDANRMTGVEVQAHCVATLLERRPLRLAPLWVNALFLFVVVFVVALVMVCFPPTVAALLSVALGALYAWLGLHLFVKEHLVVRLAPPLTGIVIAYLASALVTERRARHLRRRFRRYVGREVADQIADMDDDEIGGMGAERVVTVLFTDHWSRVTGRIPVAARPAPCYTENIVDRRSADILSASSCPTSAG
jgi:CHASE2 domain-containing sensor protein